MEEITFPVWERRQRFTNYAGAQNNSQPRAHFDSHQYNANMEIVNENSAQVSCGYSTNSQFHFNDNATSLNSIHVAYLLSHYITVTQFQYILTISIAWEFATN